MFIGYVAAFISGIIFGALIGRMVRDLSHTSEVASQAAYASHSAAAAPTPGHAPAVQQAEPEPVAAPEPPRFTATPEPAAAPAVAAGADDLKAIKGVGPKIESLLHEHGITRYQQIAGWSATDIEQMDEKLNFRGRIERDGWVNQATELHQGKYGSRP